MIDELKTKIDAALEQLLPVIEQRQAAYYASHGRYWQGVSLKDGERVDLSRKPTDQVEAWSDVGADLIPQQVDGNHRIDVYCSPNGDGWSWVCEIVDGDTLHQRTRSYGAIINDSGWMEVRA